jgi:hypothetical protein
MLHVLLALKREDGATRGEFRSWIRWDRDPLCCCWKGPALHTWTITQWGLCQIPDLQKCQVKFGPFKPPNWWSFVATVIGELSRLGNLWHPIPILQVRKLTHSQPVRRRQTQTCYPGPLTVIGLVRAGHREAGWVRQAWPGLRVALFCGWISCVAESSSGSSAGLLGSHLRGFSAGAGPVPTQDPPQGVLSWGRRPLGRLLPSVLG